MEHWIRSQCRRTSGLSSAGRRVWIVLQTCSTQNIFFRFTPSWRHAHKLLFCGFGQYVGRKIILLPVSWVFIRFVYFEFSLLSFFIPFCVFNVGQVPLHCRLECTSS